LGAGCGVVAVVLGFVLEGSFGGVVLCVCGVSFFLAFLVRGGCVVLLVQTYVFGGGGIFCDY